MKKHILVKIVAVVMAITFAFSSFSFSANATEPAKLGATREELEQKLDEVNKKLDELGSESKETKEYLSALDEKIGYLKEQYNSAKKETATIEGKVDTLEKNIVNNENEIGDTQIEISDLELQLTELNSAFEETYSAYCSRLRAMYISGSTTSILTLLLTSTGLSELLTRYEMISAVSSRDIALMKEFKEKSTVIVEKTDELKAKNEKLAETQKLLTENKRSLTTKKAELVQKQSELQSKEVVIKEQQAEANDLLDELHEKTKEYGEYRDMTQEEIDAIDRAIEEADKKYQQMIKTTTTSTTTTKKPTTTTTTTTTTTKLSSAGTTSTTAKPTSTTTTTTTTTTTQQQSSKYISLTYPCPAYPTITCGFGAYSGHTGCDFSTRGNENLPIVASESGIVLVSADITCNRSTCKKNNHGGGYCSYGRYIVIRHDKTTSSGQVVYTLYAHNNSRLVSEGQYVTKGQQIAKSGSTGNSTGPHCHYEVRVGGSSQSYAVNPANYLS